MLGRHPLLSGRSLRFRLGKLSPLIKGDSLVALERSDG